MRITRNRFYKFMSLSHCSIHTRRINVAGKEMLRREIYCVVHGFFDLFLFDADTFKADHAHCDRKPRNGAELKEALAAAV